MGWKKRVRYRELHRKAFKSMTSFYVETIIIIKNALAMENHFELLELCGDNDLPGLVGTGKCGCHAQTGGHRDGGQTQSSCCCEIHNDKLTNSILIGLNGHKINLRYKGYDE